MKIKILILSIFCFTLRAQVVSYMVYEKTLGLSSGLHSDNSVAPNFSAIEPNRDEETLFLLEGERVSMYNYNSLSLPAPPLLTTSAVDLEICTGNRTRLTASSCHPIYWYATPPPIGVPVGTGTSYITPELTTGYYTYYAIAERDGIRSDITAVEVVMVYPSPELIISSNFTNLCANETATLTVNGTTYYEWENGPVSSQMTIRPASTQVYKVTGINTAGCRSNAVYTQFVESCSTNDQSSLSSRHAPDTKDPIKEERLFSVYPNPNNGEFNIRVNSISETTRVEIYNSLGQLRYSYKVTSELTALTLNEYPNGIYIVRIIENDKVLKQKKIVKE